MRIVCLITVGAFLLSIAIAESDLPMGTTGQYNQHHQRSQRPIILEPVVKLKSEKGPLDWFFEMISRTMVPSKKQSPAIIGPFNLPGITGQVYIRQVENNLPWESSHVVIKMVRRDPITGMTFPIDPASSGYRLDDYSRRQQQPTNNLIRHSNVQHGFVPSSSNNHYSNWQSSHRPRNQYHPMANAKPFRPSLPNDFARDNYVKYDQYYPKNHQENYDSRSYQSPYRNNDYSRFQPSMTNHDYSGTTISSQTSMYRSADHRSRNIPSYDDWNEQRYRDNDHGNHDVYTQKPEIPRTTENPNDFSRYNRRENISVVTENLNDAIDERDTGRLRQVIRNDRMISNNRNANNDNFRARQRTNYRGWKNPSTRGFRESPSTKFQLEDVGGLEIVTAPNLKKTWGDSSERSVGGKSHESDLTEDEDSMSLGNGQNLARGESAEHDNNDEPVESQTSRIIKSRLSSYKIIDRSHRSRGSFNSTSTIDSSESFPLVDRIDDKKNHSIDDRTRDSNFPENDDNDDRRTNNNNNSTHQVARKVVRLTSINRWRFQEGRKPTRIVKEIYRRRPISEMMKNSKDDADSGDANEEKTTEKQDDSSLQN